MRKATIMVAGTVLLGLMVSGCSMSSFKMAPGPRAVAAAKPAAQPQAKPDADDSSPLSSLLAFASPNAAPVAEASFAPPIQGRPAIDPLIAKYASSYNVPERLIRRVIVRESGYNPAARNGPYFGLMQISHATARGMGYSGSPGGLLDAETNLRYAAKYLAGAYVTARGNEDQAMRFYASGYYYDANRAGLLE